MSLAGYFLLTVFLIGAEWLYLKLARRYKLFEIPTERSIHQQLTTIKAAGFIFYLAAMAAVWSSSFSLACFGLGLTGLTLVSLWDDFADLRKRYRLLVHVLAIGLLLKQENAWTNHWYSIAAIVIIGAGVLNAYNFMDGINGMTAYYSLVTLGTLWFIDVNHSGATNSLFPCVLIALLIFSFLNARSQAICFAGDVGSIAMGFMVLYGLGECIRRSHSFLPVLFVAVYGVDTLFTILYRLYLGQPVGRAHRLHLFQRLVSPGGWPHLRVSALYAFVQLCVNVLVIRAMNKSLAEQMLVAGVVAGCLTAGYVTARIQLEKGTKKRVGS